MYRAALIVTLITASLLPVAAHGALALRGTITAVERCYPSGYAFTLVGDATSTLIYQTGALVVRLTTVPTVGQRVLAVVDGVISCDKDPGAASNLVSGSAVSYLSGPAVTTPTTTEPEPGTEQPGTHPPDSAGSASSGSGSGSGSESRSGSGGILGSLLNPIRNLLNRGLSNPSAAAGGAGGAGGISVPTGMPFGGALTEPPIPCNDGSLYVEALSGPTPGNYMWSPGTLSYLNGPPAFPSQWLLGIFTVPRPCFVGNTLRGEGTQIVFHGSSGPAAGAAATPSPTQPAEQQSTAAECEDGQIAVKDGESFAQCAQGIRDTASELCARYGNGLRLTEGCDTEFTSPEACRAAQRSNPGLLCHLSRCHYNGTCVDMAFTPAEEARMFTSNCRTDPNCRLTPYGEQKINDMFASADAAGTRVTFETKMSQDGLFQQALDVRTRHWQSQGYSAADARVRAQADVKRFSHVTGVHFSVNTRGR